MHQVDLVAVSAKTVVRINGAQPRRSAASIAAGIVRAAVALGSAAIVASLAGTAAAQVAVPESNLTTGISNFSITNESFLATAGDVLDGCIAAGGPYKLLRFDFRSQNQGTADVVMGPIPPVGQSNAVYVWSVSHNHHHVRDFNFYDLLDPTTRVDRSPGLKQAFCLTDSEKQNPNAPAGKYNCGNQGVTWGWTDLYSSGLPCQYINITGIPDGSYVLAARTNASKVVPESDEYDNGTSVRVNISGTTVTTAAPSYQSSIEILAPTTAGIPLSTAVAWGNNRYDFFYRAPADGNLYHKYQDSSTGVWGPSGAGTFLGPAIVGAPSAASWDKNRLDVFSRTTSNKLSHSLWTPSGWFTETFQVTVGAPPSVIAPSKSRLMVMYVDTSGGLHYRWWNGSAWSSGGFLGTYVAEAPVLTTSGVETVHAFVRNAAGQTLWNTFINGVWSSSFLNLGGVITAPPSAASWNVNRVDLVGRGTDNALYRNAWLGGNTWTGWFYDGATNLANGPVIISNAPDRLDIFYYEVSGAFTYYRHRRWDGSQWIQDNPSTWTGGNGINQNVNLFLSSFADPQFGLFHTINDGSVRMRQFW